MTYGMDDPDSQMRYEGQIMQEYMEKVREEAISLLSPMQLAAIYQDFAEFCYRWKEEDDEKRAEGRE